METSSTHHTSDSNTHPTDPERLYARPGRRRPVRSGRRSRGGRGADTGRPPFEGQTDRVIASVLADEPPAPSAVADVSPAVADVVIPALETEKGDRYESVLHLRDGLRDLGER